MPAMQLSFADFKKEIHKRIGGTVSHADINEVMAAFVDEAQECLSIGYSVTIPGIGKLRPTVKAGRKKGAVVRNPFNGEERKLTANESDKFVVKFTRSTKLNGIFPDSKTSAGKQLKDVLSDG